VHDNYVMLSKDLLINDAIYIKIGRTVWTWAGVHSDSELIQSLRDALDAAAK
jgi:hypothetical protein